MASNFHVQQPYVLTTLSSPLERPDGPGRYAVGEVFGQHSASKKRKRSELSVGIDGDAANLYDVSSSNLITSYPIPPQSFFTCPPYSLRWKPSESKDVARYTYISTQDTLSFKKTITLFKDVLGASGDTVSTSVSHTHTMKSPIVHLSTVTTSLTSDLPSDKTIRSNVVAVTKEGAIACFSAETLEERWAVAPSILLRGLPSSGSTCQVQFAQTVQAADVVDGILGGKDDIFTIFPQKVHRDGFNPEVLVLITSVSQSETAQRYLQILAFSPELGPQVLPQNAVLPVFSTPVPGQVGVESNSQYRLDVKLASLQELSGGNLCSYSLSGGSVRLENSLSIPNVTSFLRLSKSSVLAATTGSLDIYNPTYRSLQATSPLNPVDLTAEHSIPYSKTDSCILITYFGSREIAVGVRGSALIAVQVEPPKSRATKRRAEGLLIDSIGRGMSRAKEASKTISEDHTSAVFSNHLPGSVSDADWASWQQEIDAADALLANSGVGALEQLLAEKFGVALAEAKPATNGEATTSGQALPEWLWPSVRAEYPRVDRRWVLYAINKVFSWDDAAVEDSAAPRLACQLADGSLVSYLADAGHLTLSNFKSALKESTLDTDSVDLVLAQELPEALSGIDPSMELLASYLSATKLGAPELISSIRLIIRSLDLVQDPSKLQAITANGEAEADENDIIGMELDKAEQELKMTELYVNDTSTRARGLSVAFSKLSACAAPATVKTMRRLLKPEETLSLINILRMELVKDGWTTRYLDALQAEPEEGEAPPDGSIKLIADLLCRCIDAIGSGGFLANGTLFAAMTSYTDLDEFFTQFKTEVSVALEGIEEAVRLRGILTEVVKYGSNLHRATAGHHKPKAASGKPTAPALGSFPAEARMLPLGLKSSTVRISPEKIVSGGEVIQRSRRETAMLTRKNLGPYVIERVGPKW